MTPVVRVPCVYGGFRYVAQADLENPRKVLLPLYTRRGVRWSETRAGQAAIRRGDGVHLLRANIGPEWTEAETLAFVERLQRLL